MLRYIRFVSGVSILVLAIISGGLACRGNKELREKEASEKKLREKYAGKLGVKEKEIENLKLYSFVDEWYGTPYKYGGKTKSGIDCSDFVSTLQLNVYGKKIYPPASSMYEKCDRVSEKNLDEGDLVFFKIDSDKVSHVGVYLQNGCFIHASSKKGVVISRLDDDYYKKHFYKGGKVPLKT